ncbi:MAG: MMPL family transporter [Solirubrobacterales bacterium]|nr:MMPL family transporter [Solirubrobacterales bacterium]
MKTLALLVAGRRTKWAMLALWLIAFVVMMPVGAKLAHETTDDTESFLPPSAESTEVVRRLNDDFKAGETTQGLIVYERDGGLTAADKREIAANAAAIEAAGKDEIPLTQRPAVPFAPGSPSELVSEDGSVAYTVLTVPTDFEHAGDWGTNVRDITDERTDEGLDVYVTGDIGFSADAEEVFGSIDTKLLFATVILVLVLLGVIYRSVLVAVTPLIVVFFAYTVTQGFIYLLAKSGETVSSNSTSILIVLMFGVGTDYCLLLVSRYREELRRLDDKHEAMAHAISRSGPAILASGLTVTLAMLVLRLADAGNTNSLGPVAAIGVFSAMTAGLTLLPALLTIFGRAGFWPRRRTVACDPEGAAVPRQGLWRRIGDRVLARPLPALIVTVALFLAGSLGILAYKVDYSTTTFFKKQTESVDGFKVLGTAFPQGTLAPMTVLVTDENGQVSRADVTRAVAELGGVNGVARAFPNGQVSEDGSTASINLVLEDDPLKSSSLEIVPELRDSVSEVAPGVTGLVGGTTAINYDFNKATKSDLELIAPLALLLIAIILAILLRALIAPLVLIASVVLSFLCTLGLSFLFIRFVVGDAGIDASIPTFAFIFLVALGIDYTIFLMARVREEARQHGTREGMLRALAATGPVITSAGIILAGTFSVLMTLPVTFTFDLGFMVALGILLDTFIVRTIMVPAAVELLGDKIWWPSTAAGGGSALGEDTGEHPVVESAAKPD